MGFDTLSYLIGKQTGIADAFDAVTTSVSGPVGVASFDDGADNVPVNSLEIAVTAAQNLHGYDNPWPAGGGKNKLGALLSDVKTINASGTWTDNKYVLNGVTFVCTTADDGYISAVTVSGTARATATLILWSRMSSNKTLPSGNYTLSGCPSNGAVSTYVMQFQATRDGSLYSYGNDVGAGVTGAVLDTDVLQATISIGNGYAIGGSIKFSPQLESGSTKTSFAPYSNICPISGWTGANVYTDGINLWDEQWESGRYNETTGAKETSAPVIRCKNKIPVFPSTVYYFTMSTSGAFAYYYDVNENYLGTRYSLAANHTFTTPADAYYMTFSLYSGYGTTYLDDISISYPSTETAYHAYVGKTYTVSWSDSAGTVYGGTLTDNGNGTWTLKARPYYASYNGETLVGPWVSSMDAYAEGTTPTTGAQVVDLGGTETEYTLTAESVRTLLGDNNIFADCGSIDTLTYRADPSIVYNKIKGGGE